MEFVHLRKLKSLATEHCAYKTANRFINDNEINNATKLNMMINDPKHDDQPLFIRYYSNIYNRFRIRM